MPALPHHPLACWKGSAGVPIWAGCPCGEPGSAANLHPPRHRDQMGFWNPSQFRKMPLGFDIHTTRQKRGLVGAKGPWTSSNVDPQKEVALTWNKLCFKLPPYACNSWRGPPPEKTLASKRWLILRTVNCHSCLWLDQQRLLICAAWFSSTTAWLLLRRQHHQCHILTRVSGLSLSELSATVLCLYHL